jgi:hypothetical protein
LALNRRFRGWTSNCTADSNRRGSCGLWDGIILDNVSKGVNDMNKSPTEELMELVSELKDIAPMSESNGSRAEPAGVTAS